MSLRRRAVSEVMRAEVATLGPSETLDLSQDIMHLGRVRHVPVVENDGRLVGMVSHRDLLEASLSKAIDFDGPSRRAFLRSVEVREVMAQQVVTVAPETPLEDAARLLVERQIGCLPVVGSTGTLLGLLTETDLLSVAFLEAEGGPDEPNTERSAIEMAVDADSITNWFHEELEELRRIRDELRVQVHLGGAELRDAWDKLEETYQELEQRGTRVARAAQEPMRELGDDARNLARHLRDGYRRIREAI